jgi:hypothetical protein
MALSDQNQNLIQEMMNWAEIELAQRDKARNLLARWNQNDVFNTLTDNDVTDKFPHLDKSEVAEGINAITAVTTALGDDVSGQAVNLIKLKG